MAKCKTSFKLKSVPSELDTMCRKLEKFCASLGLTKKCIFQLNLALDEIFTNIITHGFTDDVDHWIEIAISHEDGILEIRIEDTGVPFDPDMIKSPDPIHRIEDCKIGGLGIHLIKKMMDEVNYKRCGDKNIVTLRKNIEKT